MVFIIHQYIVELDVFCCVLFCFVLNYNKVWVLSLSGLELGRPRLLTSGQHHLATDPFPLNTMVKLKAKIEKRPVFSIIIRQASSMSRYRKSTCLHHHYLKNTTTLEFKIWSHEQIEAHLFKYHPCMDGFQMCTLASSLHSRLCGCNATHSLRCPSPGIWSSLYNPAPLTVFPTSVNNNSKLPTTQAPNLDSCLIALFLS